MVERDRATIVAVFGDDKLVRERWTKLDAELLSEADEHLLSASKAPAEQWWQVLRARRKLAEKQPKEFPSGMLSDVIANYLASNDMLQAVDFQTMGNAVRYDVENTLPGVAWLSTEDPG